MTRYLITGSGGQLGRDLVRAVEAGGHQARGLTRQELDIADTDNTALAALRQRGRTSLHLVNLATGAATRIGTVSDGRALWGMAIEP